ncbi:MAG: hypothetical protein CMJ81_24555 [Planctomycetaceae bacterium]|nr:hypothetical protein [Planctomycetaceae bacterium]MBP60728.1 hypothetical protein [Planctomycetaceae bacterium]
MNYQLITPNVLHNDNFLPIQVVDDLYATFEKIESRFIEPQWESAAQGQLSANYTSYAHCGGKDFWFQRDEFQDPTYAAITNLKHWFFSQGFDTFVRRSNPNVFQFMGPLDKKLFGVHAVAYNHGGYYNWHVDNLVFVNGEKTKRKNYFTFSLTLMRNYKQCTGGDQLILDGGKVITVPLGHNVLTVFPSYIHHAVSHVIAPDNKEMAFLDQRFNLQFWVTLEHQPPA